MVLNHWFKNLCSPLWSSAAARLSTSRFCISFQIKEPEPFAIESTISDKRLLSAKYKGDPNKLEVVFKSLNFDDPSTGRYGFSK